MRFVHRAHFSFTRSPKRIVEAAGAVRVLRLTTLRSAGLTLEGSKESLSVEGLLLAGRKAGTSFWRLAAEVMGFHGILKNIKIGIEISRTFAIRRRDGVQAAYNLV